MDAYGEESVEDLVEVIRNTRSQNAFQKRFSVCDGASQLLHCRCCGNQHQGKFAHDRAGGSCICMDCGVEALTSIIHDGDWTRSFEGDNPGELKCQQGGPVNRLLSSACNLRTGFARGDDAASRRAARALVQTQQCVETRTEQSRNRGQTTVAYKDHHKLRVFAQMDEFGLRIGMTLKALDNAKESFAGYRDCTEKLHRESVVVAACLILAHREEGSGQRKRKRARTYKELHPFACENKDCLCRFNQRRDLALHRRRCDAHCISQRREVLIK